jgi:WhiB family transcriptional regulator, redox-sensing transcriptional regulator
MSTAGVAPQPLGNLDALRRGAVQLSGPTGVGFAGADSAEMWAWMDRAACRGLGTAEFFGEGTAMAEGRARCRSCPVAEVCLWWGVVAEWDLSYRFGIWGGVGPAVRARLARAAGLGYARARFVAAAMGWRATSPSRPDTTSAA